MHWRAVETLQKEVESLEQRPQVGVPPDEYRDPRLQWSWPSPPPVPTVLRLDESLPMQMMRTGYLMPVTLPDDRVVFIPRSTLQQLLGPGHV